MLEKGGKGRGNEEHSTSHASSSVRPSDWFGVYGLVSSESLERLFILFVQLCARDALDEDLINIKDKDKVSRI